MTVKLRLKCSCGAKFGVDAKHSGKQAKCKGCGHRFTVPASKMESVPVEDSQSDPKSSFDPTQSAAAAVASSMLGSTKQHVRRPKPESLDKSQKEQCVSCNKGIEVGSVVCIYCGYHRGLKRKLKMAGIEESEKQGLSGGSQLLGYVCAVSLMFLFFCLLRGSDGPVFLTFFFASYCIASALVVGLRKVWWDADWLNHVALIVVAGTGVCRLVDAVTHDRFKVIFLLVGLLIAVFTFVITKTDSVDEGETFRNSLGGMATFASAGLFAGGAFVLGSVFFVEPIGEIVVELSFFVLLSFIFLFVSVWNKLSGRPISLGDGFGSCSSSYGGSCSSCSSCGGGCGSGCGGGCGG